MYVRMARISPLVSLSADDLAQVVGWEAAPSTPQQVALRCRLVLAAASGKQDLEIASSYDVNRHTAALWRQRVRAARDPMVARNRAVASGHARWRSCRAYSPAWLQRNLNKSCSQARDPDAAVSIFA